MVGIVIHSENEKDVEQFAMSAKTVIGECLCKGKTRKAAAAAIDEVIQSPNWRGGEFLTSKIREHFAVETKAM